VLRQAGTSLQAIMLAVAWGDPQIVQNQLEHHRGIDPQGLGVALQQALLAVAERRFTQLTRHGSEEEVVKKLMDFGGADVRCLRLDALFQRRFDRYQVFTMAKYRERHLRTWKRKQRQTTARPTTARLRTRAQTLSHMR
jgi:hypothetical protein